MTIFTVPATSGGGGPPGPPGPAGPANIVLRYTHGGGVNGGVRYLRLGQDVFASEVGDLVTANATLIGVSFNVDQIDLARGYNVEVLSDPSGGGGTGPTVIATLAFPAGTLRTRNRSLGVAVSGLLDIGVRVVRTSGPVGLSTFSDMIALVEVTIP